MDKLQYEHLDIRHADALFHIWVDADVIKYTNMKLPCTLEDVKNRIEKYKHFDAYAVIQNGELIGIVGCPPVNKDKLQYGLFYQFSKSSWGQGNATTATKWMLDYMKQKYKNATLFADVVVDNVASEKILQKFNFEQFSEEVIDCDGIKRKVHNYRLDINVNRYDIQLDMNFKLIRLRTEDMIPYKKDMQEAFQQGAINGFGEMNEEILPESHIDRSLSTKGAIAYEALVDGKMVGGAIVLIDEKTKHNHLDFLYVKYGTQSKGVGQAIWKAIEEKHPETEVWETVTPYFEKRNVHFYINCCGFHVVEFFNKHHPDPNDSDEVDELFENEYFDGMFRFEKVMK